MAVADDVRLVDGDHVVQFYRADDELVRVVSAYLGAAIADGEAVVVVAGPDHLASFERAVTELGYDAAAARADDRLVMLDAVETLAAIMSEGRPDAAAFDAVVGDVVRTLGATGRAVRAYGELVALLWAEGNVSGAIAVEELWNTLGEELAFSLFCAYPADLLSDAAAADEFAAVCHLHSALVAGPPSPDGAEMTRTFAGTSAAPRLARRFVADMLRQWQRDDLVDDGVLVVTELVTNGVVHARSDITVGLSRVGDGVRIAVGDVSDRPPVTRTPRDDAAGGRGIVLVGALAREWGYEPAPAGKVVWAELGGQRDGGRRR